MAPNVDSAGNSHVEPVDEETAAVSVPDTSDTGESGKLKMIVQLVKKCLGVKDIASMRLSLPASLLEPIPNLEYWQYLDRPDLFAAINDSEDPLERMLAVLRFTFSKDLKFIHGKVCKPYNSVLGEHFRAHWDVIPVAYTSEPGQPPVQHLYLAPAAAESVYSTLTPLDTARSETASVKSGKSGLSVQSSASVTSRGTSVPGTPGKSTPATSPELFETQLDAEMSNLNLANDESSEPVELIEADEPPLTAERPRVRIAYLTEQISHHPPISTFLATCPSKHVELTGVDQISAKVSGTTVRVMPGSLNKGIFARLTGGPGEGEIYRITHPIAAVNGILRGSFYVTFCESTIITCTGAKNGQNLRAVIEYKEESWLGKAHFLSTFNGSWRHLIKWKRVDEDDSAYKHLIDLSQLHGIPKACRPLEKQLPTESRKLWENVTSKLLSKEYSEANKHKQAIEQKQRDDAAERKRKGQQFVPVYFESNIDSGIPVITPEGRRALEEELKEEGSHPLEPIPTIG
ncbi:hypothetical protein EW026_g6426 [Hermanssonia centrifuga]|uniref:Oxysterol-binding protein n=1 Tax=Hermanssonia centrifuga TaxID=98765 RepID=A0A4S4KB23_9APHY|nr:hypothetical protein EW026_g6426 [Hermanssonia centrifuga]